MAVNKVYKIPRNVLAEMTKNNPQAIAALENSQNMAERTPQQLEDIIVQINSAVDKAEQAAQIATQSTAIAQQLLSDLAPQLNAVSVPQTQIDILSAVNVSIGQDAQLQPVGNHQDCPIQLMPI
ncbi:hypothetical protein [Psychrobacter sp. UBA2514]|jgi:hypothetical protein|uniref:hypothetical protein n=1 Tax=Psychrobacter sp. UBA2514 TaxID=1947346 RepID=UPI00257EE57C|nr:hypothetical protein [Psychrobacter sp. UBA2514]|tara:strand:+ start:6410 stop:6781 length:372 start_codon:yes stop_codon:yes gene_type:complete